MKKMMKCSFFKELNLRKMLFLALVFGFLINNSEGGCCGRNNNPCGSKTGGVGGGKPSEEPKKKGGDKKDDEGDDKKNPGGEKNNEEEKQRIELDLENPNGDNFFVVEKGDENRQKFFGEFYKKKTGVDYDESNTEVKPVRVLIYKGKLIGFLFLIGDLIIKGYKKVCHATYGELTKLDDIVKNGNCDKIYVYHDFVKLDKNELTENDKNTLVEVFQKIDVE